MDHFNIHWKLGDRKGKTCLQAVGKPAAKIGFEQYARMDMGNPYNIPFEAKITKIIRLTDRPRTTKQLLTTHYRSCVGAAAMLDKAVKGVLHSPSLVQINEKHMRAYSLLNMQVQKTQRDIRDLFKLMGLKVK